MATRVQRRHLVATGSTDSEKMNCRQEAVSSSNSSNGNIKLVAEMYLHYLCDLISMQINGIKKVKEVGVVLKVFFTCNAVSKHAGNN